jgi:SAM-dependent methyltransferase
MRQIVVGIFQGAILCTGIMMVVHTAVVIGALMPPSVVVEEPYNISARGVFRVPAKHRETIVRVLGDQRDLYLKGNGSAEDERLLFESYRQTGEGILAHTPRSVDGKVGVIVDIGCGLAGYDAFLVEHYQSSLHRLVLFDRTRVAPESRTGYGSVESFAFYNSLEAAKALLVENGVKSSIIDVMNASATNLRRLRGSSVDLVVSYLSYGFHYPLDTYLDGVGHILRPGGYLVTTLRGPAKAPAFQEQWSTLDGAGFRCNAVSDVDQKGVWVQCQPIEEWRRRRRRRRR